MNKLSEKVMKDFLKTKSVEQIHFDKLQEKGLISEYENIVLNTAENFYNNPIKWLFKYIFIAIKNGFVNFLKYLFVGMGSILFAPLSIFKSLNGDGLVEIWKAFKTARFYVKYKDEIKKAIQNLEKDKECN
ncbi:hypothetical protein LS77_002470 [Helicobacter bilis]|uniref:Uncharacterized protein n=2 Tax=Helicobacter bilis TaxID=37372 RepID=A0A6D2CDK2_9HELI|nr:hypothetical protein [Helicobacter bilis]EMZ37750.1 hypothetical protein C826_01830 [Helicobacter bilis WiWa]TLE05051.1 hypothetical protein LS76_006385 [Helicobacter bilis]TLE05795.1 hypothetical protein LS77_002470 [Helicobacter bilis]